MPVPRLRTPHSFFIPCAAVCVPLLAGKLYYKAPGKLKLERNGGISVLPRKSISLSVDKMMPAGAATVIDAGREQIGGIPVRVIKIIPEGEGDIILAKVWVDEARMLALRTETTTRESGTVRMELSYDKYAGLALPDKIIFVMDVKQVSAGNTSGIAGCRYRKWLWQLT